MTTQTPPTAEIEKWLRIRVRFFAKFWLRIRMRKTTQNAAGVDSGIPDPMATCFTLMRMMTKWPTCFVLASSVIYLLRAISHAYDVVDCYHLRSYHERSPHLELPVFWRLLCSAGNHELVFLSSSFIVETIFRVEAMFR